MAFKRFEINAFGIILLILFILNNMISYGFLSGLNKKTNLIL